MTFFSFPVPSLLRQYGHRRLAVGYTRPRDRHQHQDCQSPVDKGLRVLKGPVCCNEKLAALYLCPVKQRAIMQVGQPHSEAVFTACSARCCWRGTGGTSIAQYPHNWAGCVKAFISCLRTTSARRSVNTKEPLQELSYGLPSLQFSKRADKGHLRSKKHPAPLSLSR